MSCQVLHDVHRVWLMAGIHRGLALLPSRTVVLCVSVVTPCWEDGAQIEVNFSWSLQYHANGKTTLQLHIISHFSNFGCQVVMWVVHAEWAIARRSSTATSERLACYAKCTKYLLHCILLCLNPKMYYLLSLLKYFSADVLEKKKTTFNAMSYCPAARIRKNPFVWPC